MNQKREPITPEGYQKLIKEIEHIKMVERPANIKAIEEARSHGDLSENAEYDAAKNEQGLIESRLNRCEDLLARVEIIDPKEFQGDEIVFGAHVELVDLENDEKLRYRLVGTYEADLKMGSISIESPVGRALIGRKVGDEVRVKTPKGERELAVVSVKY